MPPNTCTEDRELSAHGSSVSGASEVHTANTSNNGEKCLYSEDLPQTKHSVNRSAKNIRLNAPTNVHISKAGRLDTNTVTGRPKGPNKKLSVSLTRSYSERMSPRKQRLAMTCNKHCKFLPIGTIPDTCDSRRVASVCSAESSGESYLMESNSGGSQYIRCNRVTFNNNIPVDSTPSARHPREELEHIDPEKSSVLTGGSESGSRLISCYSTSAQTDKDVLSESEETAVAQNILDPSAHPIITDVTKEGGRYSIVRNPHGISDIPIISRMRAEEHLPPALTKQPAFKILNLDSADTNITSGTSRRSTLPIDPTYVTPEFKVLPSCVGFGEEFLAKAIFMLTNVITIMGICIELLGID